MSTKQETQSASRVADASATDRYRTLFASLPDAAFVLDESGRILEVNAETAQMYGYASPEEMIGLTVAEYSAEPEETTRALAEPELGVRARRHRRRDGTTFPIEVKATFLELDGHKIVLGVVRDITERKQLEAAVARQDRLATMGLIATGLGHELNNPLAYVLCNVELLVQRLPEALTAAKRCGAERATSAPLEQGCELVHTGALEEALDAAREALEGLRRISATTRRLGTLSKLEQVERSFVDVDQALERAATPATPASEAETRREKHPLRRPAAPRRPRGRVLVVDDEESIVRALARLLGRDHEIVTASSGEDARALLETDRAFDVVLSDLMMPDLSGMDLHAWLTTLDPTLARHVVFMTGGAFLPRATEYLASVPNLRIEKPFDAAELGGLIAELVLAARGQPGRAP
jgi:PAS domain S-box-containing protein